MSDIDRCVAFRRLTLTYAAGTTSAAGSSVADLAERLKITEHTARTGADGLYTALFGHALRPSRKSTKPTPTPAPDLTPAPATGG